MGINHLVSATQGQPPNVLIRELEGHIEPLVPILVRPGVYQSSNDQLPSKSRRSRLLAETPNITFCFML